MALTDDRKSGEDQSSPRVLEYGQPHDPLSGRKLLPNPAAEWSLLSGLALAALFLLLSTIRGSEKSQIERIATELIWIGTSLFACGSGVIGIIRARRPGVEGKAAAISGLVLGVMGAMVVAIAVLIFGAL